MLRHLTIKNYALIDHLEMELSGQLNVITGETGAGKSIMLGAMSLLLGNRADTKVLWNENEKCITEGIFEIRDYNLQSLFEEDNLDYDPQTVLRREINPGGKSRAFINDTPVTLDIMRKIGSRLMDVHSQHETLDLGNRLFQLHVVDMYAANNEQRENYKVAWNDFVQAKSDFDQLEKEATELRQESDFIKFQLDELTKANLEEGEQQKLESSLKIMEHAEDIKTKFNSLLQLFDRAEVSAVSILDEAKSIFNSVSSYSASYQKLSDRLESIRIELLDIIAESEQEEEKIEFDPAKIEDTKERLSLIYQLMQKHRLSTTTDLIQLQNNLQQKANKTEHLDEALANQKLKLEKKVKDLEARAEELSLSRTSIFKNVSNELVLLLNQLGIPEAKLQIEHHIGAPGIHGKDTIEFLFSANKGIAVRPLAQVASGGEFSRVMFCIKYILAAKTSLPTLILDEIDTGVSGEIAIQLGKMMKLMAKKHQLLTISHLPQIAAKADFHFYAFKISKSKKTISQIKLLTQEERVNEIAKMIGGDKPSFQAKESAKELIMS